MEFLGPMQHFALLVIVGWCGPPHQFQSLVACGTALLISSTAVVLQFREQLTIVDIIGILIAHIAHRVILEHERVRVIEHACVLLEDHAEHALRCAGWVAPDVHEHSAALFGVEEFEAGRDVHRGHAIGDRDGPGLVGVGGIDGVGEELVRRFHRCLRGISRRILCTADVDGEQ